MKTSISAVILLATLTLSAQEARVPVYIFTKASAFVDADSQGRTDAMADLIKSLGKNKTLRTVTTSEEATLHVEITGRAYEATGEVNTSSIRIPQIAGGGVRSTSTPEKNYRVHAILIVGDYHLPIVGQTTTIYWKAAAEHVGKQVEKWVKANRGALTK